MGTLWGFFFLFCPCCVLVKFPILHWRSYHCSDLLADKVSLQWEGPTSVSIVPLAQPTKNDNTGLPDLKFHSLMMELDEYMLKSLKHKQQAQQLAYNKNSHTGLKAGWWSHSNPQSLRYNFCSRDWLPTGWLGVKLIPKAPDTQAWSPVSDARFQYTWEVVSVCKLPCKCWETNKFLVQHCLCEWFRLTMASMMK